MPSLQEAGGRGGEIQVILVYKETLTQTRKTEQKAAEFLVICLLTASHGNWCNQVLDSLMMSKSKYMNLLRYFIYYPSYASNSLEFCFEESLIGQYLGKVLSSELNSDPFYFVAYNKEVGSIWFSSSTCESG